MMNCCAWDEVRVIGTVDQQVAMFLRKMILETKR